MIKPVNKSLGFLKTTALGGAIFLLPLIVLGALLGEVAQIVIAVAEALNKALPIDSAQAWTLFVLLAIVVLLTACFFAGLAARWTFGQRLSVWMERKLTLFFPRYVIVKARMAGSIGGEHAKTELKPVLVTFDDMLRIAFEVERQPAGLVTIYLPGAPDPWAGSVVYVEENRVKPLNVEFSEALSLFERLGRDSVQLTSDSAVLAAAHKR